MLFRSEAIGQPGDVLVGISTSGRSKNVLEAFALANKMDVKCLALLGSDGGDLSSLSDVAVIVPSWNTQRIQEVHTLLLHLLCELVEKHINSEPLESTFTVEQNHTKTTEKLLAFSRVFSMHDNRSQT